MFHKVKILAVDDRPENLLALRAVLNNPAYEILEACSGEEALKLLLKNDVALILLDVQMAGLNGFDTARLIRQRHKNEHIPIIFISAIHKASEHILEGYSAGAVDYIFKPFQPETLRRKVEVFINLYQEEMEIRQQRDCMEALAKKNTTKLGELNSELIKSNEQIVSILESISDAFYAVDPDWRFSYVNKEAEKEIGKTRQELIGKRMWEAWPLTIKLFERFRQAVDFKQAMHFETIDEKCGKWYEIHIYPSEMGLSVYFRNISERIKYEKDMARLDRLNLTKEVAAGIAHEIRNPLTKVRGFLQLFINKAHVPSEEQLIAMIDEIDRANAIIAEFLGLAKNRRSCLKIMNLSDIVRALYPLIQAEAHLTNNIVNINLEENLMLLLDEKEIRQLILNMALNGLDAMAKGGKLTISTYREGTDIILSIADEGDGIKDEVMDKIGTPFFTTKDNGTGLGLAICYSVAARHNAKIEINTGTNGTVFIVRFACETEEQLSQDAQ
ncbi:Sensor histidine kinase RcsC [Sporomusa carbonis]|uniref:ATP-binding response regulator n=1 Tax=Sporomusa carbonis TaxID=3076075 RepID=UPI003A65FB3F